MYIVLGRLMTISMLLVFCILLFCVYFRFKVLYVFMLLSNKLFFAYILLLK